MEPNIPSERFPGFEHPASSLSKFAGSGNLFTLLTKDGQIIHFEAGDRELFRKWLLNNEVKDIKKDNPPFSAK